MDKQFTASEVRNEASNHWRLSDGPQQTLAGKMLHAFADMLEARKKAVPVMVVNHVSSAEHDLPIGMKLYAHPSPADADWKNNVLAGDMKAIVDGDGNVLYVNKKIFDREVERTNETLATVSALTADAERLAEALHSIGERLSSVLCDPFGEVVVRGSDDDRQIIAQALKDLGELAAHSAQAQPPAARVPDWTDAQCVAFMAVGLRHTEYKKGKSPTVEEIRQGAKAALAAQENPNG